MRNFDRRRFLSLVSRSAAGIVSLPVISTTHSALSSDNYFQPLTAAADSDKRTCWLDVCAPFILEDENQGLRSEIVLTSDTFIGRTGYADGIDATEYELYLYDSSGRLVGDRVTAKLKVPAMNTTTIAVRDLIAPRRTFWGGLTVRLRPSSRQPMHATDLFSSAFVRWQTKDSFTHVHANPDPLQWQRPDSFYYSMPFPPLREYDCVYSVFNPYAEVSAGSLIVYDPFGVKLRELPYQLEPHSSLLLNLRAPDFTQNAGDLLTSASKSRSSHAKQKYAESGGTIAVVNRKGSVKNFGYLLIKQLDEPRFSVEHPIHQPPFDPLPATASFDSIGRLKAKNVLYTPLVFNEKHIGGVTLKSRFHLSSGAPMEPTLRMSPFITDANGNVAWQIREGNNYPNSIAKSQVEKGVIKLGAHQSCIFDCTQIGLSKGFSGGFSLAVTPTTNHTLMKVEIIVDEWKAVAFTHFRPGLAAARSYQKPAARAGLATDYIASAARVLKGREPQRDEIIAIVNVDDKAISGSPTLEVFTSRGLLASITLGEIPAFGCRHYLLSELLAQKAGEFDLTLRLIDEKATLLMSVVHMDYVRQDIALDHGSDRFSTFTEFTCDRKAD